MAIVFKMDGGLLPFQSVRFPGGEGGVAGLPSSAWYGDAMTAGITIEDPNGTIDVEGWHTFTVDETACAKPRMFTGWILGKGITRGPYVNAAGRIWDCEIIDQNALFSFEVFRASSAKRPAETDLVRAAFAIASAPMGGTPIHDNGRANFTDNPRNFGDADYIGQYPMELFTSITAPVGKNFYAYWDDAAAQISLHYDLVTANPASTLRLSNVLADVDSSITFAPAIDAKLDRDPVGLYTGVLFNYRGAYVYARNDALIDDLSPTIFSPVAFRRDLVYRTDRVGELATATLQVQAQLTQHSVEQDLITCMVQLPASKVNLLHAGMALDVKFSHLPSYTTFTTVAVTRRNVIPTAGTDDLYDVHLELTNSAGDRGPGGGDPGDFPPEPPCTATAVAVVQSGSTLPFGTPIIGSMGSAPTPGNTVFLSVNARAVEGVLTVTGFTPLADTLYMPEKQFNLRGFVRVAEEGDTADFEVQFTDTVTGMDALYVEYAGTLNVEEVDTTYSPDDLASPGSANLPGGTVTVPTGGICVFSVSPGFGYPGSSTMAATGGSTELAQFDGSPHPQTFLGEQRDTGSVTPLMVFTAISGIMRESGGWAAAITCTGGTDLVCPDAGQWTYAVVPTPTPDGTSTTFTLPCAYADGSLTVWVDRLNQTAAVTTFNGAAGTFILGFAPAVGMLVECDYQGR